MQLIPSAEVREGQCVARDVRNSRGTLLVCRGQRLTSSLIARLHKFGIEAVYIRDGYGDAESELLKSELRQQCQEVLNHSFANLAQEAANKCLALDTQAIQAASENLIEALMSNKNPLITLLDVSTSSDHLLQHSVSAAVLAITLALDMGVPPAMLMHLASAMLFHDIGMIFLPDSLKQKAGRLAPQEVRALREHTCLGFEHLVRNDAVSKVAANIVLRHHEALDGSGYPEGVRADKLSLLVRIANVVEIYDSLTSVRSYAPAVMPDVALSYILTNTGKLFAKEVVLALCRRVALYPTGTAVQLNTGERCIVVRTLPDMPMRPTLKVLLDHKGRKLNTPLLLDLMQERARFVVRSAATMQLLEQARSPAPTPVNPVYAGLG